MTKLEMTEMILAARKETGITWESLATSTGLSPVFLTSACLGMNSLAKDKADIVAEALGLDSSVSDALQEFPKKGWAETIPQDPVIYRLYEIVGVYGDTMKEIIHEKFGDGIMSAIDFSMQIDKEENPAGDRVVVTMNGKFLPYKAF